jgi:Zn-dependent membrane protease YugP
VKGCLLSFLLAIFILMFVTFPLQKSVYMTIGMMGITVIFMLVGMMVQFRLKSKFSEYRKVPTSSGLSGKEVAEKMLRGNGIYDVQVISVPGFLSDHYYPTKKNG